MKSIIVSPTGIDTQDGSELTPLLTVNRAMAAALPGDTVVIRGTITGQTVTVGKGGTAEAPISVIQHADGGAIDGKFIWPKLPVGADHLTGSDGTISHYGALVNIPADYVRWSVDARNSLGRGISVTGDNVTLVDCWVDYCNNACINVQECSDIWIQRVRWSHGGWYDQTPAKWPACCHLLRVTNGLVMECEGFENLGEGLAAGRGCTNVRFVSNKLWDNLSVNLYFDRANRSAAAGNRIWCTGKTKPCEGIALRNETYGGAQTPPLADVDIDRNVIFWCSKGIVLGRSETAGELMQRVRVSRNTLANDGVNLFANAADHRAVMVEEDIFYQDIGEQAEVYGIRQGEYTFDHNGWGGTVAPPASVTSPTDVYGVELDADFAPLADYGIGAMDYVAPPPVIVPDELVRLIFATKMSIEDATQIAAVLNGKTFTLMVGD